MTQTEKNYLQEIKEKVSKERESTKTYVNLIMGLCKEHNIPYTFSAHENTLNFIKSYIPTTDEKNLVLTRFKVYEKSIAKHQLLIEILKGVE